MKADGKEELTPHTPSPVRSNANDAEPSVAHTPAVSVWLFIIFALLLFLGMTYLNNHAGGFNPNVYQYYSSSNQLVRFAPPSDTAQGAAVYLRTCVACHQPSGLGTPGQFPTLVGSEWVLEENPARVIRIILHGLQGPIEVKGQQFNNVMLPWKDTLKDEEIAAVASYVRKSWGNDAPLVKKEQVTEVRQATADRATYWTAQELLSVPVPKQ